MAACNNKEQNSKTKAFKSSVFDFLLDSAFILSPPPLPSPMFSNYGHVFIPCNLDFLKKLLILEPLWFWNPKLSPFIVALRKKEFLSLPPKLWYFWLTAVCSSSSGVRTTKVVCKNSAEVSASRGLQTSSYTSSTPSARPFRSEWPYSRRSGNAVYKRANCTPKVC